MFKRYLVKQALGGSILQAQMTHPFSQPAGVPVTWDVDKQRTLDQLTESLPPSHRRVPLRSMLAREKERALDRGAMQ